MDPFAQLRQDIRNAHRQFRKNNDNSPSIFRPEGGFVYVLFQCYFRTPTM